MNHLFAIEVIGILVVAKADLKMGKSIQEWTR